MPLLVDAGTDSPINGQIGRVAHRFFHILVLPHLLLPESPFGLPDALHADVLKAAEYNGWIERTLIPENVDGQVFYVFGILDEYVVIYMVSLTIGISWIHRIS